MTRYAACIKSTTLALASLLFLPIFKLILKHTGGKKSTRPQKLMTLTSNSASSPSWFSRQPGTPVFLVLLYLSSLYHCLQTLNPTQQMTSPSASQRKWGQLTATPSTSCRPLDALISSYIHPYLLSSFFS